METSLSTANQAFAAGVVRSLPQSGEVDALRRSQSDVPPSTRDATPPPPARPNEGGTQVQISAAAREASSRDNTQVTPPSGLSTSQPVTGAQQGTATLQTPSSAGTASPAEQGAAAAAFDVSRPPPPQPGGSASSVPERGASVSSPDGAPPPPPPGQAPDAREAAARGIPAPTGTGNQAPPTPDAPSAAANPAIQRYLDNASRPDSRPLESSVRVSA